MYRTDTALGVAPAGNDVFLGRGLLSGTADVYLYGASSGLDVFLYSQRYDFPPPTPAESFPTQYAGLRYFSGTVKELCLVDPADAPPKNQWRIRKGSTTYAVYLVELTDPNASGIRIKTVSGIVAARLKTTVAPAPTATWDPLYKRDPYIVLSESDRLATVSTNPGWSAVRATISRPATTASHYFEVEVVDLSAGWMVGVANSAAPLPSPHVTPDAWFYWINPGWTYHNGVGSAYGGTAGTGDVVGVLLKNGKVYISINGSWQGGGDPVAETGEAFSGLTGDLYPFLLLDGISTDGGRLSMTSAQLASAPPSGSSAWA